MEVIVAVLAGLCLGSFTSVFVERLGVKGGIVAGRSECPSCGHSLAWYDLVPLFSFLILRGRCRYCHTAISSHYPMMEVVMAAALGAYVYMNGLEPWRSLLELGIIAGLVMLFFFDLRRLILPDEAVLPVAALAAVRIAVTGMPSPASAGVGALFLMLLFGVAHLGSGGKWMGFGDVGLGAVIGLVFGWPGILLVLFASVWTGALVGIILMSLGRAHMKTALPFGSFLAAVSALALIWPGPLNALAQLLMLAQ